MSRKRRLVKKKKKKKFKILKLIFIIIVFIILPLKLGSYFADMSHGKNNISSLNFFNKIKTINKEDEFILSENAYAFEREKGKVVFKKNENKKAYPASLTKVMTTLVALENIDNLNANASIDIESYRRMIENNASMAGFYGKEMVTYRDLLYGTIMESGGEAANSLAINISGNIDDFVSLMNDKAKELGLKNTNFVNVEGLHDKDQYTTAKDMASLLDYALNNRDFRAIFTKEEFVTTKTLDHPDGIKLHSTVLSIVPDNLNYDIIGGKSGTTNEAGQCWITLGIKNGKEYIVVTMNHPFQGNSSLGHREDTLKIFESIK